MQSLASAVRDRAAKLGLSNAEVARRAGLTERRYGNYVAGIREPDLATLLRISSVLGTTPDRLLGLEPPGSRTAVSDLMERLRVAASTLTKAELDAVVLQVEALANRATK